MNDKIDLDSIKDEIKEKRNSKKVFNSSFKTFSRRKRFGSSPFLNLLKFIIAGILIALLFYTLTNLFLQRQTTIVENKAIGIEIINQQIEATTKSENKTRIKDPLEFYYYMKLETFSTDETVNHFDLKDLTHSEFFLKSDDLYRFSINPAGKAYCYVFQFNADDEPIQIHPTQNSFYQMLPNTDYHIPSSNGWVKASQQKGLNTVYMITSFSFLPDLEELYVKYLKAGTDRQSKLYASQLKLYLETLNNASFNGFRKLHLIFS